MDAFDERIKRAQQTYEPSPGFVDQTMDEVRKRKVTHRRFGFKLWAPAAGFAVLVLAVVLFIPKQTQTDMNSHGSLPHPHQKVAQVAPSDTPAPISDGTDNTALAADLNIIQASVNQSANDQTDTDNTINDQAQEISVEAN